MLDPTDLYDISADLPAGLGSPILIQALDGFVDAGQVRELVHSHLLGSSAPQVVVSFDVDQLLDYRARRPYLTFVEDRWTAYDEPRLDIVALRDAQGTPYLLLAGPEPDFQWDRFSEAVRQVIERLGVRLTVGVNAIPMGVPHTRPIGITAHASRKELIEGYQPWVASVQVPGSAGHLLEHRLATAGHDSMGFAVHVPHYLAQAAYPPGAEALVRAVGRATGLTLSVGALEESSREAQESIAALVGQSEELTELVRNLEEQYDAVVADRGTSLTEAASLPTGDELGAELERFLAERGNKRDDPL
ncbi:MAG: hypothetical protein QOC66_203 [Pseudonocardiales bacterium]|nr:hypothetical protein [Pseudonocardiales bacterium]